MLISLSFLDRIIVKKLSRSEHISSIENVSRNIGIIYKLRPWTSDNTVRFVYCTLILLFCSEVWGSTYKSRLNKLCVLQKKCMRIIGNASWVPSSHIFEPLFKRYKCFKRHDLIESKSVFSCTKLIRKFCLKKFLQLFPFVNEIHNNSKRQSEFLCE